MADGQTIGTAYLEVKPKVDSNFGKDIESKGTSVGTGFGSSFSSAASKGFAALSVAAGNILASIATSAASAIGDAFADMITGAMDYQQLAGGVEKIFDQANIDQILRDANAAYKDLNMSANEYLASINQTGAAFAQTMGDQKGYDIARKGMLAISDYASGTGRSIDELNDKYALITRSTSSYQSIADQFSGILPATSKDFLAQAQAAGYLSKEYKSLTEVPIAEYQEAVTQMLEKGVDDMGLAGNTAAESAETMSGSLAMLSSAWSNLLANMLNENANFGESFDALLESIGAVIANFAPRILTFFGSLLVEIPKAVVNAILRIPDAIEPVLADVFGEDMAHTITENMRSAFAFIGEQVMPFIEQLATTIMPAVEAIGEMVDGVMTEIGWIVTDVMTIIGETVMEVWPEVQSIITTAVNAIKSVMEVVWPYIQGIVDAVMNVIHSVVISRWEGIKAFVTTAVGVVKGAIDGLQSIVGVVTNIFNQVKEAITHPIETAKGIIRDAINTIKSIINGAHLELPHFKLPHFNINGGELPWGIGGQGTAPSISVEWYASGGFVNGAQLIGAGEAGPEMILPAQGGLMDDFSEAVASQVDTAAVVDEIRRVRREIGPIIADYAPHMTQREFNRAARTAVAYG